MPQLNSQLETKKSSSTKKPHIAKDSTIEPFLGELEPDVKKEEERENRLDNLPQTKNIPHYSEYLSDSLTKQITSTSLVLQEIVDYSKQKDFDAEFIQYLIKKILRDTFQLADISNIQIIPFLTRIQISNDFIKFAKIDKNYIVSDYMIEISLSNEHQNLKKILEKPEEHLQSNDVQKAVESVLGVIFRLAAKSDINVLEYISQAQAKQFLEVASNIAEKKGIDVVAVVSKTKAKTNGIILQPESSSSESTNSKKIRLNDLGLPMHPLEIEVADLVDRAKAGEQVFPKYERAKYGDPVAYLKEHYGKYLKKFNYKCENEDFLYLDQLTVIDKTFKNTLASYLHRADKLDVIPTKSRRIDKEQNHIASCLSESECKKQKRINSVLSGAIHRKKQKQDSLQKSA